MKSRKVVLEKVSKTKRCLELNFKSFYTEHSKKELKYLKAFTIH